MFQDLSRPIIFAHRGASAYAPENTLASFELAFSLGADAIELDARLSADGQVVVIHDSTVDRTTDHRGRVAQLATEELRSMDAGAFFSDKYRGEKIPLLDEVFEALGNRIFINVELKDSAALGDRLVDSVCSLIRRHGLENRILLSSFLTSHLGKAKRLLPDVPRALLTYGNWMGAWARSFGFSFGDYIALHPHLPEVTQRHVARVHRLERRVHVWTVNKAEDMLRLNHWGVDGFLTDDPQLALKVLGRSS